MEDWKITVTGDNGEEVELYVVEETMVGGVSYLMVSDTDNYDEEWTAYIMKDMSAPEDKEAVYEFLEDGEELEAVGRIFEELLYGDEE
ncbi:MAG: DUF1292 domain-containing protein [Lachnospiraceae bacterium]|nr:DUF1292 domain-containing protein [Lachnospiraceae bacterium]